MDNTNIVVVFFASFGISVVDRESTGIDWPLKLPHIDIMCVCVLSFLICLFVYLCVCVCAGRAREIRNHSICLVK